jgi:nucleotide-binding universal stress UspA family protein
MRGPVLVGTDLTEAAEEALRAGAELARALNGRLVVCHVIPELLPEGALFGEFRRANLQAQDSILAKARLAVQEQLDSVITTPSSDGLEIAFDTGRPHSGLLRQAENIGGRGCGDLARINGYRRRAACSDACSGRATLAARSGRRCD